MRTAEIVISETKRILHSEEASMTHPGQSGETESVVLKDAIVSKDISAHDRSRRL